MPTVKEILLKWNIDNSNWKTAISDLARLVEQQAAKADKAQADSLKKLAAQKAKIQEVIEARESETEKIRKQIDVLKLSAAAALLAKNEALAKVAAEKASAVALENQLKQQKALTAETQAAANVAARKAAASKAEIAELNKQVASQKMQQAIQKTLQNEVQTKLLGERLVTAEITKQAAELRKQITEQKLADRKAPINKGTSTVTATAGNAALQLRIAQAQDETLSLEAVAAERQKIIALADKELSVLRAKGPLEKEEVAEVQKLLALRSQQISALAREKEMQERALVASKVSESSKANVELNLKIAQDEQFTLQEITAERQRIIGLVDKEIAALKEKGQLEKQDLAEMQRLVSLRNQQSGSIERETKTNKPDATSAVISTANQASTELAVKLTQDESLSLKEVAAERQRIIGLVDKEIATLRAKGTLDKDELAGVQKLLSIRNQQVAAIEREVGAQKAASASSRAQAELMLRISSGEVLSKKALEEENEKILKLMDEEIAKQKSLGLETEKQVAQVNRLIAARDRQARSPIRQPQKKEEEDNGIGSFISKGVGGAVSGFLGSEGAAIGLAVVSAEAFGEAIKGVAEKLRDLTVELGPLQQVQEQFAKLAKTAGLKPDSFIDGLRESTKGLVADTQLYRTANLVLQSGVKASQADILKLTEATVGLARAQGRDATSAIESLNRFFLTGYTRSLAWSVGLNRNQLEVKGLGNAIDPVTRTSLGFAQALKQISAQYEAVGAPTITFSERLKQLGVAWNRVTEEFGVGLIKSDGFKNLQGFISNIVDGLNKLAERAGGMGATFGDFLGPLVEGARAAGEAFAALGEVLAGIGGIFKSLVSAFGGFAKEVGGDSSQIDNLVDKLTSLRGVLGTLSEVMVTLGAGFKGIGATVKLLAALAVPHSIQEKFDAVKQFVAEGKKIDEETTARYAQLEAQMKGQTSQSFKIQFAAPTEVTSITEQLDSEKKLAKVREEIAVATSKVQLEATQTRIKKEEELVQFQYDQGLTSLAQYLAAKKTLDTEDFNARIKQLNDEFAAKEAFQQKDTALERLALQERSAQLKLNAAQQKTTVNEQYQDQLLKISKSDLPETAPTGPKPEGAPARSKTEAREELAKQYEALNKLIVESEKAGNEVLAAQRAELNAKELQLAQQKAQELGKINAEATEKDIKLQEQQFNDLVAARKKVAEAIQAIEKQQIEDAKQDVESQFQQGEISAQEYLDKRVGFIEQEYQSVKTQQEKILAENKNTDSAIAEFESKMATAAGVREKALTQLTLNEVEIRSKAIEQSYDRAQKLIGQQITYQQSSQKGDYFGGGQEATNALIQTQISLLRSRLEQEQAALNLTKAGTEEWANQEEKIQTTKQALIQYNEQLAKSQDFLTGIASAAKSLAQAAANFPKGGGRVSSGLNAFASQLEEQSAINQRIAQRKAAQTARAQGASAAPVTPQEIFKSLQKVSTEVGADLSQHLKAAQGSLDEWKSKMGDTVTQTNNLIKAFSDLTAQVVKTSEAVGTKKPAETAEKPAVATSPLPRVEKAQTTPMSELGSLLAVGATSQPIIPEIRPQIDVQAPDIEIPRTAPQPLSIGKPAAPEVKALGDSAEKTSGGLSKVTDTTNALVKSFGNLIAELAKIPTSLASKGVSVLGLAPASAPAQKNGLSGPANAANPLGTTTASDLTDISNAALTSSKGGTGDIAKASTQAATGLSTVAQTSRLVSSNFQNLLQDSFGSDGLIGAFKNMSGDTEKASEDLSNFVDSISKVSGEIGGLMSAAKGTAGSPVQSALQGASAGAGLGGQIGNLIPIPGAGIIGSIIGGGVGGVLGIFGGKAKKEAEKIAKQITAQFDAVLTEVQQGTLGLGSAVTQEIATIQSAVDQLSGKKGGRDQLKQILPQMEQQLLQLQEQQQSVIKSFDQTVEQISAPEAYQSLVSPIQQIIQQYQQYILAGGNVQTANQYLQDSFKNLVQQGLDTLNQSEQDAINNALQYNDLLLQRQDLIQSTNQQIQDIMSQGVAVRQMPEGVSKAQQIEQVMQQSTNQMDQLNEEIAVSQHRLQNEQAIFQLATTRVGLETQLVQLQDSQVDEQDASTKALLAEVEAYSQATPTNLPTALSQIGLGSTYINPSTEPGLKPTPPVPTGIASVDQQNQLQYQQALAYYNQQAGLSSTATTGSLASTIPGGTQGITIAGSGSELTSASSTQLGSVLDSIVSNITAFPQTLSSLLTAPNTVLNVGGTILQNIAEALGVGGKPAATTLTPNVPQSTLAPAVFGPSPTAQSDALVAAAVGNQADQANQLVTTATQRLSIENNISSVAQSRIQQETALVALQMQEIQADMQRIQAWQTFLQTPANQTSGSTIEDLLQQTYNNRARQGIGGFYGETANPL